MADDGLSICRVISVDFICYRTDCLSVYEDYGSYSLNMFSMDRLVNCLMPSRSMMSSNGSRRTHL